MPTHTEVLPEPLPAEPLTLVAAWFTQAWHARQQPNPNAMVLATATPDGRPSARVVLCKDIAPQPGYITFYTNYQSRKGGELTANPRAAVVMHWDHMHRQVRIEGAIVEAPAEDSDTYFASRALESRIGAWASQQSQPIASRAKLLEVVEATAARLGVSDRSESATVPRPPHWGGFRLWADAVEIWAEGDARIHDRARWTRSLTAAPNGELVAGAWSATRLQP